MFFWSTSLPIYGEQSGPKPLARKDGIKLLQFFFLNSCAVSGAIYNIQRNKMQIDVTLITGIFGSEVYISYCNMMYYFSCSSLKMEQMLFLFSQTTHVYVLQNAVSNLHVLFAVNYPALFKLYYR